MIKDKAQFNTGLSSVFLKLIFPFSLFLSFSAHGLGEYEEETLYDHYVEQVLRGEAPSPFSEGFQPKIYTDALWDTVVTNDQAFTANFDQTDFSKFEWADKVRVKMAQNWPNSISIEGALKTEFLNKLSAGTLTPRDKMTLLGHEELIENHESFVDQVEQSDPETVETFRRQKVRFRPKNGNELKELFFSTPDLSKVKGGKYKDAVKMFMFCRYQRYQKCLLMMTNKDGEPVMLKDGKTPWSHPALGMSRLRLPSWRRNGNTPEGVFTVDGVMPYASKKRIFGKYRRLILNFLPRTKNESLIKSFLPESAKDKNWWKSGVVARDIGRNLLRIHGSGIKRARRKDPFYPLRPTLGCVMQRELRFWRTTYKDQRKLLDRLMVTSNMKPVYKNETKIKALLYVIEIDKKQKAVTLGEIRKHLDL